MLDQTLRTTILALREAGRGTRAIARALGVSRGAVKAVLADGRATPPPIARAEKAAPHRDEIIALYKRCATATSCACTRSCARRATARCRIRR